MQTCETCRFLEPDNRPDYTGCGTCRRFPPIVVETVAFDGSGGIALGCGSTTRRRVGKAWLAQRSPFAPPLSAHWLRRIRDE